MIDLTSALVIGSGNERICYRHPLDPQRVIKVSRPGVVGRQQNRIDQYYLASLEARGVPTTHVPRQYGLVATSLGDGLVLDCITNADGSIARSMADHLKDGSLPSAQARTLLDELYQHLLFHSVVLVDVGFSNLALRNQAGCLQAVVIDGLGGRHFDLRLRLRTHILWLARRKLRKQWSKWASSFAKLDAELATASSCS